MKVLVVLCWLFFLFKTNSNLLQIWWQVQVLLVASCLALVRANSKPKSKAEGTREARQYDEPYSDNYVSIAFNSRIIQMFIHLQELTFTFIQICFCLIDFWVKQGGMPYSFSYSVYDPTYYNDYGHHETSDGKVVRGGYRVALPDGRTQVVNYHVEGDSGFVAHVNYHGQAHYPDYKPGYEGKDYQPKPEYFHKPEYSYNPEAPEHTHPAYKTDYPLPPNYTPYTKEVEYPGHHDHGHAHGHGPAYDHDHAHGHAHEGYTRHYPQPPAPTPHEGYNKYPHDGYSKRPDVYHPEPYHPAPYREPAAELPIPVKSVEPEPPKVEPPKPEPVHQHPEHHHEHEPAHYHQEPPRYEPESQYHAYPGHYQHDHYHHDYPHAHDGYTPHTPHYEDHGNHYHAHGHDDPYPKTYVHYEQPPSTPQIGAPIKLIDVGENFNPYGYSSSSKRNVKRPPAVIYVRKVM